MTDVGRIAESWEAANAARRAKHPDWNWGMTKPGDFSYLGTKVPEGSRTVAPKSPG